VAVTLPRPRERKALNHDPVFKEIRGRVIEDLIRRGPQRRAPARPTAAHAGQSR
jgi:hypothetical protein